MSNKLHGLASSGVISWLSYYFAEFIAEQSGDEIDSLLAYSAALVSESNQQGDVCVELSRYYQQSLFSDAQLPSSQVMLGPNCSEWQAQLLQSHCVGVAGDPAPLILENDRLYLNRYWYYENQVAQKINAHLGVEIDIDEQVLATQLTRLFRPGSDGFDEDQKLAVALSACSSLSVISGGPGTGKTTTVIKILCVLLSQHPDLRIALAAPTGKAAARMTESIRLRLDQLDIDPDVKSRIPANARTMHRLLQYRFNSYRYNHSHRLAFDCVVVDEASMIDLTLMHRLLAALPDQARLILLGDRDQLASVSAGNILGDITGHGHAIAYSDSLQEKLARIGAINAKAAKNPGPSLAITDSIALLTKNFRFEATGRIGDLAALINQGKQEAVIELLKSGDTSIHWIEATAETISSEALESILVGYRELLQSDNVSAALIIYQQVRVLCALNFGPFGVSDINRFIEKRLGIDALSADNANYRGRPVMINRNDHDLGLFNGDTGIIWADQNNRLQAWFRDSDTGLRTIALHQLPQHSTAWAMTVHKSQGSEFDQVMIILPADENSAVLSRELLYTGVTRAKKRIGIYASEKVINNAVGRMTIRSSGLAEKLGWPGA